MQAYCVKCKMKVDILEEHEVIIDTKRGKKKFLMGKCKECGTKVSRVLGNA